MADAVDFCFYLWNASHTLPLSGSRKMVSLQPENGEGGFDPGLHTMNSVLSFVARCEPIPQGLLGTSVMAVLEKAA
jgi:hypothetical protein